MKSGVGWNFESNNANMLTKRLEGTRTGVGKSFAGKKTFANFAMEMIRQALQDAFSY